MRNNSTLAIVLHWGDKNITLGCVLSLEKNTGTDILIVNNTGKKIQDRHEEIVNQDNLGFAGGMNIGLQLAIDRDYKYTLMLNNDTLVDPKLIQDLSAQLAVDGKLAAIAPTIVYQSQPDKIWFGGGEIIIGSASSPHWLIDDSISILPDPPTLNYVSFLTGCCVLFRTNALKMIGLLDTDYFLYFEDDDWDYRATGKGWKLGHWSAPLVQHAVSSGSSSHYLRMYYYHRNRVMFIRKNFTLSQKPRAYAHAFVDIMNFSVSLVLRRGAVGIVKAFRLYKDILTRKTGSYDGN